MTAALSPERAELISTLTRHRTLLLQTAAGLTEQQARECSTVSSLCIASLLKHVADTEHQWMSFALEGASAFGPGPATNEDWSDSEWVDDRFDLTDEDTLPALRERIREVAARTEQILTETDLDQSHPLPEAPWFEPGVSWSVRRVALHLLAEISQHAGHADIIREAIDGAKSMG